MSAEPHYEVVSPVGQREVSELGVTQGAGNIPPANALVDLDGKKIGLVWTVFTKRL